MFTLGHLSDLHTTPLRLTDLPRLANKRLFGWLSWMLRRRRVHRPHVLEALIADLRERAPDQVVVTGDLTNISLPHEYLAARAWLECIGRPDRVFAVPGNHDAYVPVPRSASWDHWADYLASDDVHAPEFPTLRLRGPLALVGVCTAEPTPLGYATGSVGAAQLERLEKILDELVPTDLWRVVVLHHPLTEGATHERRSLRDAGALRDVLRRAGAELVLHGHNHRCVFETLPGPERPIPVVGVRSASDGTGRATRGARYHLYDFEGAGRGAGRIRVRPRTYDPATRRVVPAEEREL